MSKSYREGSLLENENDQNVPSTGPRIALLTPYNGGNLGDAAIQDSMIANLHLRLPAAQFSGISLNCESFMERHDGGAFPLCATDRPFYGMFRGIIGASKTSSEKSRSVTLIKRILKRVPVVRWCLRMSRMCWQEPWHWVRGYRFLRTQDILIVSGGGQLNEEWGGPWSQPFALFKWALLARVAQIPYVIVSVGAGKATSRTSRLFLSVALRIATYRSYRDKHSRAFAASLMPLASLDPVVPDLALSLPASEIPEAKSVRSVGQTCAVVAVSPIAFAKPSNWPTENRALYDRYVGEMAGALSKLLERGYFLIIVWSSLGDDQSAVADLLQRLDDKSKNRIFVPSIATWKDFVASLWNVDVLIASRLHSAILSFVCGKPVVAISFDPKVDWVMEDLGQLDYLMQIRDFSTEDVMNALDSVILNKKTVTDQIISYQGSIASVSTKQYDTLAEIAVASCRCRG